MKNAIFYATTIMLFTTVVEAQNSKVKLSFDYGRSRSFLNLEEGKKESANTTYQLGMDYLLGNRWHLNLGIRHMTTGYATKFSQREFNETSGSLAVTNTSTLNYRHLGFPIGVGYEPLKHLVFQISIIPTHNETAYTSQNNDANTENNFTLESTAGLPRQFGIFWGASAEYGIAINQRLEIRLGARATASGKTLLKDEAQITKLTDYGAFLGIAYKL
ncbi:MAG: hypothetical protein IT258_04610 [Saprospiraceae bacterium]|nr:hypothetical protein [Saprospiraceae bacterium]